MIHPETHAVTTDNGPRPAGPPDRCFYCGQPVGGTHEVDCVCRKRTVVIEVTVRFVVAAPESWTKKDIDFHRNHSSSCASNTLDQLTNAHAEMPHDRCPCSIMRTKYVRDATPEDEYARIVE